MQMILARQAQLEFLLLYTQLNPKPDSVQTKSFISLLPGEKKKKKDESHVNQ